jgi:hypothetical protein
MMYVLGAFHMIFNIINYDFFKFIIFSKFVISKKYEFYVKNHTKNT